MDQSRGGTAPIGAVVYDRTMARHRSWRTEKNRLTRTIRGAKAAYYLWAYHGLVMSWGFLGFMALVTAAVVVPTALYFVLDDRCCPWGWYWAPLVAGYVWVPLGGLVTLLFTETIRRLYQFRWIDIT